MLFGALIVWMYWRVAYVPGGQAIGWLERIFDPILKWVTALVRKRRTMHTH